MKLPNLAGQGAISIDVETYDPDLKTKGPGYHRDGYIAGIAVGTEKGFREYYPLAHEPGDNVDKSRVLPWLHRQLQLPVPKIGANLIYDLGFLEAAGVKAIGPFHDIQIAEPLIDETRRSYSLEALSQIYLKESKVDTTMIEWIVEHCKVKENKAKNFIYKVPPHLVRPYAIGDIDLPLRIFAKQQKILGQLELWPLFEMESKLIPLLLAMRQRGMRVDLDRADVLYQQMTIRCANTLRKIKKSTGVDVDIWASKSVAKVFDKLGLKYPRTEITDAPSFRKEFLENHRHPIANAIREVRRLDKLKETFIKSAIVEGHYKERIHCSFNQLRSDDSGTVSGRLSSSSPNLQQVPIRTEEGALIRSIFLPDRGQDLHKLDWSQIEYRLMVHDANHFDFRGADEVVDVYRKNADADFHQIVADMTGLDRARAKTVNFGIAYGEGVAKLCRDLNLELEDGQKLLREYHKKAPFMRPLMNYWMERAETNPFEVRTLFKRIRHFNKWSLKRDGKFMVFDHRVPGSERAFTYSALNARIQGSAADIMKTAMVNIQDSGVLEIVGAPHLTVHDELVFSAPKNKKGRNAIREIKYMMEHVVELSVPLLVDAKSGPNWGECK